MRCYSCNHELSDKEAVRKLPSGDYAELCSKCFNITFPSFEKLINPTEQREEDQIETDFDELYSDR